eukprot:6186002-Lingulodinium_polyedra.AAC.1
MGWVHGLYWCQRVHGDIVHRAVSADYTMRDHKVLSPLEHGAISIYVDNGGVLADTQERCAELHGACLQALHAAGLDTRE